MSLTNQTILLELQHYKKIAAIFHHGSNNIIVPKITINMYFLFVRGYISHTSTFAFVTFANGYIQIHFKLNNL